MGIYTTELIETLDEWNALLQSGCCCEMPECPTPVMECQSLQATRDACDNADTQYEEAYAAWLAGGGVGDEPVPPDGYGEWDHTCSAPFTEPADIAGTGYIPTIYRRIRTQQEMEGTEGVLETARGAGPAECYSPFLFFNHYEVDHVIGQEPASTYTHGYGEWTVITENCDPPGSGETICSGGSDVVPGAFMVINHPAWTPENNDCIAEPTYFVPANSKQTLVYGSPEPVPGGCPSAWPYYDGAPVSWANLWMSDDVTTLSDGISMDSLKGLVETDLAGEEWPEVGTGHSACQSSYSMSWPKIESLYVGDPEAWPACDSLDFPDSLGVAASATLQKFRFRWEIPDTFTGSYFKITWDVLEEPDGWDATIPDPENPGGPPIPDPAAPQRSFASVDNTWTWAGPGSPENADSWKSGWYEIAPPTVPGVRKIVNIRFECYRGPYGTRPQITGTAVEL